MTPETLLKAGDVEGARQVLMAHVRSEPGDARARIFLFQLLAVLGQWERAGDQLVVSSELDPANTLLTQAYGTAARAEVDRASVFAGRSKPTVIGEPEPWVALLLHALKLHGEGRHAEAAQLREQAFEEAPAIGGTIDGLPFQWLADADSRMGPCLEIIVNRGYAWLPFARVKTLVFEAPSDLRDKVWAPVQVTLSNGGQMMGFVPARYPDTERSEDGELLMARKTTWLDLGADNFLGVGQRMFVTDVGDHPLLDIRRIEFDT